MDGKSDLDYCNCVKHSAMLLLLLKFLQQTYSVATLSKQVPLKFPLSLFVYTKYFV